MAKLTARQQRFVDEYLIDLIATQAAIRAGYSPAAAGQQGCELLKNPKVRACIDTAIAERSRRTGVNSDRVVRELARLAFVNAPDVMDVKNATVREDATRDDTATIASVKIKVVSGEEFDSVEREIKLTDKVKALELLGKHLGMFDDRTRVSVNLESLEKLDSILGGIDEMAAEDSPDGGA